jgi:hypothetical protein
VEPVKANQNLPHAELATVTLHLLPVGQVKMRPSLKPLPAVPHAEAAESKDFNVPGHVIRPGTSLINPKTMEYFAFQWHITDSCDQRCKHCYIFSENNHSNLKEMSWTEIESVFENCQDMCKKTRRIPYFYITGGDPILHSRVWDLIKLFKSHKNALTLL